MATSDTETISIEVDGTTVTGVVERVNAWDISISIASPFVGLTTHLGGPRWLPPMSAALAAERCRDALFWQYRACQQLVEHRAEIATKIRAWDEEERQLEASHPDSPRCVAHDRRELRKRFKAGDLTQQQYQRALAVLRDRAARYRDDRASAYARLFTGVEYQVGIDTLRRFATSSESEQSTDAEVSDV